jgi:hypothetical protein
LKKLVAIVVIWAVILGGAGGAYYYLFYKPGETPNTDVGDKDKNHPDKDKKGPDKDKNPPSSGQKVKLALDSFSGYCIFRSDEFKKKLAAQGVDCECVNDNADYPARMKTVANGETPLAVFTIDALINNTPSSGEPPAVIVMAIDETRGADAMVGLAPGTPDVDSMNRADQKIVLVEGSPSETLARVVRSQFKLPDLPTLKKDFLIAAKEAQIDDVYEKFQTAKPFEHKAFVLWEPFVSKALKERPEARVLFDSSKVKGYIVDVLVMQRKWLGDHPAEAKAVVQSYLEILHAQQQSAGGMAPLVLSDAHDKLGEKLTDDEAASIAKGIWWKNTLENYGHFGILSKDNAKALQPLEEMIRNITAVLNQTRQPLEPEVGVTRPEKLYNDSLLRGLYEQKPSFMIGKETIYVEPAAAALSDADWARLQRVGLFKEDPIQFRRASADFSDATDAQSTLADVADKLRRFPQYYLQVEGNTLGDDNEVNRQLVKDRANAVKKALVESQGVDAQRIRAVGNKPGQGKEVDFVMLQKAP